MSYMEENMMENMEHTNNVSLVREGLDAGLVKIVDADPGLGCDGVVCRIWEHEFYFADVEEKTAAEYLANHGNDEIAVLVADAIHGLRSTDPDEAKYYELVLSEELPLYREAQKIPFERRSEYAEAGISMNKLMGCVSEGWDAETLAHGYFEAHTDCGTDIDIPHAVQIQKIDVLGFYLDDDAARSQAQKDGVKLINDMPGLECGVYVDTPKNREACSKCLEEHPEYRIENISKKWPESYMKEYVSRYGEPQPFRGDSNARSGTEREDGASVGGR